ncbi:hypothetical protein OAT67_03360 [Bacteriovoracaceae bacterium]|nr:hypothetical protein [Bacteriovoracaceae bacterium]
MKDWESLDTLGQSEALINELKGNLFEYLVAQELATRFHVLSQFYSSFAGELKHRLGQYELWLRDNDPLLMTQLPKLALKVVESIIDTIPVKKKIEGVFIIGKTSANIDDHFKEADIVLTEGESQNDTDVIHPISIKLCKTNAFVNTKSGGIRSFLTKYFHLFDTIKEYQSVEKEQEKLNELLDFSFERMGKELYDEMNLSFQGSFDQQWTSSHLPGQLPENLNKIVLQHYYRMNEALHYSFQRLKALNDNIFQKCLQSLLGFGREDLIQVICFHGPSKNVDRYDFKSVEINHKNQEEALGFQFSSSDNSYKTKSSFELGNGKLSLQVRIKPMNVFTTKALKVNCSIKSTKS